MKINDKGQCPYQSSTWMCFSEHESHSAAGDCLVRLVERRGQPGDASACSGASCSFRPGTLCGMRTRRARGMSLVEGVGGLISAIGPGSGMGVDWGHGVDTGPGGCGFGKGRSWELGGRGRPDWGGGGGGGRPGCVRIDGDLLGGWQSSRVAWNHHDGRTRDDRCVFPEELSVAKGDTTRTIHSHNVLVELSDLNDHACLVPFSRVGSSLVLNPYSVADSQWWEDAGVFGQPLSSAHMSVPQCFLPGHEGLPPGGVGLVLA